MEEDQEHTYRVVRFEVIPQSIRLEGEWGGGTRGAGLEGPGLLTFSLLTWLVGPAGPAPVVSLCSQQRMWGEGRLVIFVAGQAYHNPQSVCSSD